MKEASVLGVVVLVAVLGFGAGWGLAGSRGADARLADLEARVAQLGGRRVADAQAAAPRPPERQKLDVEGAPARGPEQAAVTLVEFSDFECPYCLRVHPTVERLRAEYPDQLRVVFKHFPLSFHQKAMNAHRAAMAAGKQGKFWEMHDLIFENPRQLDEETMKRHAETLALDTEKFEADYASEELAQAIQKDLREGRAAGVRGTPAFFINGRLLSGAQPYERFKQMIDEELEEQTS